MSSANTSSDVYSYPNWFDPTDDAATAERHIPPLPPVHVLISRTAPTGSNFGFEPCCPLTRGDAEISSSEPSSSKRKFATKDSCTSSNVPDTGRISVNSVAPYRPSFTREYPSMFGFDSVTDSLSYSMPSAYRHV